jgi:tetratricopeptide (TPR) repeat protein/CHAT domain-containing protein
MKPTLTLGIIVGVVVLCQLLAAPNQILAEEDPELTEIQELIHQVDSLAKARELDTAIVLCEQALEKAKEKFGESDTTVARALNLLGLCYYYQANYAQCESLWNKTLAIREKALGPDHPHAAQSLNNLGLLYWRQGKYAEAEPLYKRALAIKEKALGPDHPDIATSLNNLAILYVEQGKYAEAEPFHRRALAIREKVLGPDHLDVAKSLSNLGILYRNQGKYKEAEPLYSRALAIKESALGPDHPNVAVTLNSLALLYWNQGKYTEAEPLYKRALTIGEKALGSDHPSLAPSLNNLALLYWDRGRLAQAEPLHKRALAIKEKTLGPNHPDVAISLDNLALLYRDQGKYGQAEPLHKRALTIRENALGSDHPRVAESLNNLGLLYCDQGKFAEAEALWKRALAINEKALGPDYPSVGENLDNLALFCRHQGRYAEAESLYRRAQHVLEKALGPGHPNVARSLGNLAFLYSEQGKYVEAEPLYNRALGIAEKALGPDHPDAAKNLKNLAILYASSGQIDKSLTCYKKLQKSRQHFVEYVFSYASEEQKMRYIRQYPLVNHSLFSFAIMANSDESRSCALEMILKGKAVVMDAVSAEKQIAFCPGNEEIQRKAERHAQVCGELSCVTLAGAERLDPEIYRDRLQALYSVKDSLETELSKSCAEFKDELAARRFAVADVASALPQGAILLELVRYEPYDFEKIGNDEQRTGPPRYLAFTLDHAGNITLTDLGDAGEIDSLVRLARKQIYQARAEVYSPLIVESERRLNEVTGKLYDIIWAPLESHFGNRTDIFISPDGQLSLLPFEILPCPDGEYVIEKFRVSYLSSGRDLLRFKRKQKPSDWALVIADPDFDLSGESLAEHKGGIAKESLVSPFAYEPLRGVSACLNSRFNSLPYTREEGWSVGKTLEEKANLKTQFYQGSEALEEVLKGMATAPSVLHLATHGYFCQDLDITENSLLENPLLRSGLALAGANHLRDEMAGDFVLAEDGILTAFEASGLNLVGTELATLSACETGIGEVENGEGVYGLRRAFQHAGVRTIVMSLWKVPDKETRQLMDDFYSNWLAGQSKRDALHQSVLKLLNKLRDEHGVAHPLCWGGFVLLGDPN